MVLPCLMGAFNSIGGSCFGWVGERIKTEAALLIAYGDNIENLRRQVQSLSDAIEAVKRRIQVQNLSDATLVDPVVDALLKSMESLKEEASKIISDEDQESDSTCLMGLRPNLWACYWASKSAKKAIDKAVKLLEEETNFARPVANVDYLECLGVTPISDFEEFESRVLVLNQIVAALEDPNVNKVGVYGMGGTGKTTLAEKIGEKLQLNGTFSYVVLATVSEQQNQLEPNLLNIQNQIAGWLKIQLQSEILSVRAEELRKQLQKRDKVLIILDDIWSKFELKDVGIPVGSSVHTKFKILMTSRNRMVLENEMDSTNNFGLDSLPFDDARKLFDRMVGGASKYSNWRHTAEQVVEQCGGIPILLATTGRALRNVNQSIWEDALTKLKEFDGVDYGEEAYKRIEVSYEFLKNEKMKKLFLLCAQLDHRSIGFEELLRYTMGLDLFKERKKLKEVSGRLHKYLHDLKGCCLLQDGNEKGIIKMHDVVHKFATFVASRDHDVFSVANDGELEEWPSKDQFEKFTAISFFYCRLPSDHMLPAAFDNPKLESFLMLRSWIDASFKIPDNFYAGMKGLKLMNLTRMSLSPALVSSLSALVKIRTLCLDHCELGDIAVIGELPMLQALSLTGSSIVWVPKEIGKLGSTLKLLDLRNCLKLETIASGVISRLTLLEDLRIGDSFTRWERLEGSDKSSNSADETYEAEVTSLEEFKNLRNLINLKIHIREHAKMFPKDLVFKKLETFRIFIGKYHRYGDYILPRTLEVNESSTVVEFDSEGTKALMTRAESLWLAGVKSSVSVSEMDPKGFPELKYLNVNSGDVIQYIVKKNYNNCIFPKLETLRLWSLHKLERICDDHDHPRQVRSFENLRVINVSNCNLLNDLLSSNLARGLLRLKEIIVKDCESMESIIVSRESENEEEIKIGFTHQLQALTLRGLPRLLSFYSFKQLEGLPSPTPFFNKKIVFPKLEELELSWMKIEKIWDDHLAIAAEGTCWFQNLTRLKVDDCGNLSYLFTFSMVKSFAQLKNLDIGNCESIEEIVATRKGEMEGERLLLFPKLENLVLSDLPKLKFFCHANLLECQSLQKLEIEECPLLNAFIGTNDSTPDLEANSTTLFDEKIVFPKLEELSLNKIKVEKIWDDESAISAGRSCWLQNLTSLNYLFTFSMVKSFAQLKNLKIRDCESIEEIVATRKGEMEGERLLSFPKLENLELYNLPKLKFFCHANLFECQSLQMLSIEKCPLLNTFIGTNDSTPDLGANSTTLFDEKIVFPKLEVLELRWMKSENIWDDHLAIAAEGTCWFQNLTSLNVQKCVNLSYLFTFSMVKSFAQLKNLDIRDCESIEEIVATRKGEMEGERLLLFPKLEYLVLSDLPKLKFFGHANLLECQSLQKLKIEKCPLLNTFIGTNDSTPNLGANSTTLFDEKVAFPNMKELLIARCYSITSIFPTSLVPTLHQLERLVVRNCDSLDLFGINNNTQQRNDAFAAFAAFAKVFSSLKSCYLESGGIVVIYQQNFSSNMWELKIDGCNNFIILFALLKSFPKLDKVEVSSCSIIFPCEPDHLVADDGDDMDTQAKTLARIQHLKLTQLSNMKHILSEHSPLKYHGIPRDLKVLEVVYCTSLLSLAPPSTTLFKNLTGLIVWRCPMLIKLVASSSTAKSLVNLKEMSVTKCDSLEEIVVIDDQWDELASNDEHIVFEKLEVLELQDLNSLTSFCSTSDCNFRFPSLNRVIVANCPKMKFFSEGALKTPKLIRVWPFWVEDEDEEREENQARWEGDLNSTIRQLFEKMTSKSAKKAIDEAAELLEQEKNLDRAVANVDYSEEEEDEDSDEHEDENEDDEDEEV